MCASAFAVRRSPDRQPSVPMRAPFPTPIYTDSQDSDVKARAWAADVSAYAGKGIVLPGSSSTA